MDGQKGSIRPTSRVLNFPCSKRGCGQYLPWMARRVLSDLHHMYNGWKHLHLLFCITKHEKHRRPVTASTEVRPGNFIWRTKVNSHWNYMFQLLFEIFNVSVTNKQSARIIKSSDSEFDPSQFIQQPKICQKKYYNSLSPHRKQIIKSSDRWVCPPHTIYPAAQNLPKEMLQFS